MTVTVFGYLIVLADISTIFVFCLSLVLVPIEKLYQTLKTPFEHLSKHLKIVKNTPLLASYFNCLLCGDGSSPDCCLIIFSCNATS